MRFEMKYGVAGIAILLATLLLFGCINTGTVVPSFLAGSTPSINSTGVYVTSGSTNTGWQNYFAIYAFKPVKATVGGQTVQLTVPTHVMGNGIFGLYKCPYNPSIYYIITGTAMPAPDTWKLFELSNPTSLVTVDYEYVAKEAVVQDMLNTQIYDVCGGGYDLQGQPTGAPIRTFTGNAVHLEKDFSTQPTCGATGCPVVTTCSDGTQSGQCSPITIGKRCQASNLALVTDATCNQASTDCSDGTKNNVCSVTTSGAGKRCVNGQLSTDDSCVPQIPAQKDVLTQIGEFVMGVINSVLRLFGLAK